MTKTKTKKRTAGVPGETTDAQSQDNFNQLYTAHQVHTLAQIVYQHLTRSYSGPSATAPAVNLAFQPHFAGTPAGMAWPAQAMAGPVRGMPQVPAPALFYWYP